MVDILVIGGGEHARVVMEACLSQPTRYTLVGFLDPNPCPDTEQRIGVQRIAGEAEAVVAARHVANGGRLALGVGAVGVSPRRAQLVERLGQDLRAWAPIVHASAVVSPSALISAGVFVSARAVIGSGATLGDFAVVNTGAIVEHDVGIGAWAQIGPAAALGGGAHVEHGAYVALGARVRDHVRVGRDALVALGAAVTKDVPEGRRVQGVPARIYPPEPA